MTRGFLFFWVYTLPLVLLVDYRLLPAIMIVILVTFGFVGIEYVSMALDDPFGKLRGHITTENFVVPIVLTTAFQADDTNDVDEHGMALLVYEDIYMALYRTDGPESAMKLRERVLERYKQGRSLDCYREDLKGYEIWETASARHDRMGPSPDWSCNPPPKAPSLGSTYSSHKDNSKSTKTRSRRRPPTHPPFPSQSGLTHAHNGMINIV